ncbi:hypothetical protein MDAP_002391 [Mitosporidium daphniae]|uniref:Uncharacterized protein n=1 Tax=Mitosporidium daphniae TaxID=1485682 RepID=A0A098VSB3_9MICR|nr:uncharacterized protein DI09_23p230 [Mitosporidium daphniae]KGG51948.1 hypothetical protein DI09_23p230 [Mitosporidium daphniae]|eukprot:XP_013238375.1 uncharacterized protein DI09_23p230 [Mitosporidium daphniae]
MSSAACPASLSPFSKHMEHDGPVGGDTDEAPISTLKSLVATISSLKQEIELSAPSSKLESPIAEAELATSLLQGLAKTFCTLQSIDLCGKGEMSMPSQANHDTKRPKAGPFSSLAAVKGKDSPIDLFQKRVDVYVSKIEKLSCPQKEKKDSKGKSTVVNTKAANRIVKETLNSAPKTRAERP